MGERQFSLWINFHFLLSAIIASLCLAIFVIRRKGVVGSVELLPCAKEEKKEKNFKANYFHNNDAIAVFL